MPIANRLERYEKKRDFSRTSEPRPTAGDGGGNGRTYTIQKHAARQLHFDLRLEHDGALLSFAIAKGPSLDPSQKRLAVRTEDHPLDYATFEGTIPKGEYGGGTVMLWDCGTWRPHEDVEEGLAQGKLTFDIEGERLHGGFALVQMKGRGGKDWLLIKERDGEEDPAADPVRDATRSIASNRTMDEIAKDAAPDEAKADKPKADEAKADDKPKSRSRRKSATPSSKAAAKPEATRLTHPDRVLFPATGLTKQGLADYFRAVAEVMLPHVAGHPLSLVRCPEGRARACFFQKHHTKGMPAALRPIPIEDQTGDDDPYLVLDDVEGLVACAQVGALELHVWGARADALEAPDRLVLDLDPSEDVSFNTVKKAAREVRDLLETIELPSFPLLTGGKGIHVIVPLSGAGSWDEVKALASALAKHLAAEAPDRYLAKASKAERKGRIFIDWLRNTRGATAIAPFSPRARDEAPVATPIRWDELGRISAASAFTTRTITRRLAQLGADPWEGFDAARADISAKTAKALQRRS